MKSLLRWLIGIFVMLGTLLLSNCSPYGCRVTFGDSTCNGSGGSTFGGGGNGGGGGGGGGGNNGNAAAFVFESFGVDGGLDEYELFPNTQSLALNPNVPFQATSAGIVNMVMAGTQDVYQINSSTGQIYGWTVGSDGTMTAISGSPVTASYLTGSPATTEQAVISNPAGTLLFVRVQVPNEIYVYQIGSGGVLSQASGSPFALPPGFVPENLATDGKGKYLYVTNVISPGDLSSQVAAYTIGTGSSVLTAVSGSPFPFPMWQMQGDGSGAYMIATEGQFSGDANLHVFAITQSGASAGAIAEVLGSPFSTVNVPADVAVQPGTAGTLVYSFSLNVNNADNPIEGYQLNTSSGALTAISTSPFAFIGRDGQFDQTGQYFFAYDGLDSTLWVFNVGSGGALSSQLTSTGAFLEPWVASDVP